MCFSKVLCTAADLPKDTSRSVLVMCNGKSEMFLAFTHHTVTLPSRRTDLTDTQRWQGDTNEVLLLHLRCETAAAGQRLGSLTGRRWDYQNKAQRVRKWKFFFPKGI